LACSLAACGQAHAPSDASPCAPPALAQDWLAGLLSGAVGHLAQAPRYLDTERAAARAYLADQLSSLGYQPMQQAFATGANVYATLDGTVPQQVVVGAHFDTVSGSPGADDNATGVASVLALAHYLRDTPCRGPTVVVAFFDQEEEGLFGSRAFAQMLQGDVAAVHTIDQIGWDSDHDGRVELELPTPALEQEYRAAAMRLGVPLTTTSTAGSDHSAFRMLGFPAVGLTEGYVEGDTSPYRHTPQDTAATVDAGYLATATQLLAQVVIGEVATDR
jgi:Zn-dependent M28 family amino/carboxypeptidase